MRYLGFQAMSGIENIGNIMADDLEIGPDGTFEIVLSADTRPGNWMALSEGSSSVVVRQFFYDWENEEPAHLEIECSVPGALGPGDPASCRPPASPAS